MVQIRVRLETNHLGCRRLGRRAPGVLKLLVPHGVGVAPRLALFLVILFALLQVAIDLLLVPEVKG